MEKAYLDVIANLCTLYEEVQGYKDSKDVDTFIRHVTAFYDKKKGEEREIIEFFKSLNRLVTKFRFMVEQGRTPPIADAWDQISRISPA